jgi:hypothetical protein
VDAATREAVIPASAGEAGDDAEPANNIEQHGHVFMHVVRIGLAWLAVACLTLAGCETRYCGLSSSESNECGELVMTVDASSGGPRLDARRFDAPVAIDAGMDAPAIDAPVTDAPIISDAQTGDGWADLAAPSDAQTCSTDDDCPYASACQEHRCRPCAGTCTTSAACAAGNVCHHYGGGRICSFCGKPDAGTD